MKVLIIDVNYKNSSTGKIVYDIYSSLINEGHDAKVCYGRGAKVDEPNVYKFSGNIEVYTHALLTRVTGLTGNYSNFATKKLLKIIDEFKPDIVHIHELHAYFVNLAPLINYLKENRIETIWTFHCEFMYTGKCGITNDCEKWKVECGNCPQIKEYPASLYFDFTKKMFNEKKELFQGFDNLTIVTPSEWLADRVRESFLSDKDIRVLNNGIDTKEIFYPRVITDLKKKHNLSNEKIVLAVAPDLMSEHKGGHWVLKVAERMLNHNVKFILIGVNDLNVEYGKNVIAIGRTENQSELAEYYTLADITLLTSLKETFSLVSVESLACGTPVVGFDSGAPKEIAPKGYGEFVAYGNIDKLTSLLFSNINNPAMLNSSEKCVEFARRNYDKQIMFEKYLELYKEKL